MRPPNYTLLMIWIPVILLASVIGYLKRENLYMLYDTKYWAAAAMVSYLLEGGREVGGRQVRTLPSLLDLDLCDDFGTDVESNSGSTLCSSQPTNW